jgi:hypothetical protein
MLRQLREFFDFFQSFPIKNHPFVAQVVFLPLFFCYKNFGFSHTNGTFPFGDDLFGKQ